MKIITFFVAGLMMPLNALAWQSSDRKDAHYQQLQVPVMNTAVYSQNPTDRRAEMSQAMTQAPVDKQSQLFIELCVYIIIIMVYSLYWLKVS